MTLSQEVAELRQEKKGELAKSFEDIAWLCVTRLSKSDLLRRSERPIELSTVAGTAVDKMRLLRGESFWRFDLTCLSVLLLPRKSSPHHCGVFRVPVAYHVVRATRALSFGAK